LRLGVGTQQDTDRTVEALEAIVGRLGSI
jgi:hypothetical protein